MKYEILLIRHGLSCSNAMVNNGERSEGEKLIDPALSPYGIEQSSNRLWDLNEWLESHWSGKKYGVCSSFMLRAKMTAWYMALSAGQLHGKTLHILPFIGEQCVDGKDKLENTPISTEDQEKIFGELVTLSRDNQIRDDTIRYGGHEMPVEDRLNIDNFLKYLTDYNYRDESAVKGFKPTDTQQDRVFRGIVFTHFNFIKRLGKKFSFDLKNYKNNDMFMFTYDTKSKEGNIERLTYYGRDPSKSMIKCDSTLHAPVEEKVEETKGGMRTTKKKRATKKHKSKSKKH